MKKILCLLMVAMFLMCTACKPKVPFEDDSMSYSQTIKNVKTVNQLTGKNGLTNTLDGWQVGGTDLGFPIYNSKNDTMYLAFGDTFFNNVNMTGLWRSNVLATSQDFNLSDGLEIDNFYKGPTGVAKPIIEGHHLDNDTEVTKIPTGGIEIDGVMYMFYMSVRKWTTPGEWLVNYCSAIKSDDNGATWERVYDLTYICDNDYTEQAVELANENVNLVSEGKITKDNRLSNSFMQVFPIDGKDGYIYLFGLKEGRSGGAKQARVKKENFENFNEYEYYCGITGNQPIFVKGGIGLEQCESDDGMIIEPAIGEISIMYNEYLKKWVAIYYKSGKIIYRTAENLYSNWSKAETIITSTEYGGLYGGMCHEKYILENGKVFYFILSQWMPTYNTFVIEVTLE